MRRLTSDPADMFGIKGRGPLQEDLAADIGQTPLRRGLCRAADREVAAVAAQQEWA